LTFSAAEASGWFNTGSVQDQIRNLAQEQLAVQRAQLAALMDVAASFAGIGPIFGNVDLFAPAAQMGAQGAAMSDMALAFLGAGPAFGGPAIPQPGAVSPQAFAAAGLGQSELAHIAGILNGQTTLLEEIRDNTREAADALVGDVME
jgi:hypothetical protein